MLRTVHGHGRCRSPTDRAWPREVRMYRPRHAKSKHWRRRVFVAASLAGGTLLLAVPAFAGTGRLYW
jgi:hypothetical protein